MEKTMTTDKIVIHSSEVPIEDAGGARLRFLAHSEVTGDEHMGVLSGSVWPGLIVPLHSHEDVELFYIQSGVLEHFQEAVGWVTVRQGDLVIVRGSVKHAWRNSTENLAEVLVFTWGRLCKWLEGLTRPFDPSQPPAPPTPEYLQRLVASTINYGYWTATPEENAAIGLTGL